MPKDGELKSLIPKLIAAMKEFHKIGIVCFNLSFKQVIVISGETPADIELKLLPSRDMKLLGHFVHSIKEYEGIGDLKAWSDENELKRCDYFKLL